MFERYTEKARRAIFFARYEASQFGSPFIEAEHLLLGLLREDKAVAKILRRSHGSAGAIRKQIESRTPVRDKDSTSVNLPLSRECKHVLRYAAEEAALLEHRHIGTEHLFLGLLREEKCFAAKILSQCGLRLATLREEVAGVAAYRVAAVDPPVQEWLRSPLSTPEMKAWLRQFYWEKRACVPQDALKHKLTGQISLYRGQPYDPAEFEVVKAGWTCDHCAVCWNGLFDPNDLEHSFGYTNGGLAVRGLLRHRVLKTRTRRKMNINRRDFIKNTAAAGLAMRGFPALLGQTPQKYRVALVGTGWWGMNILHTAMESGVAKVVAMCDVDENQLNPAADNVEKLSGDKPVRYHDFRELLEKQKPDITIVATPDHWHPLVMIAAVKAGCHVYVEKPISHTVLEGKAMVKAARDADRTVTVGLHRRVSPHNVSGMEFLKSGRAGRIGMVRAFVHYPGGEGESVQDSPAPPGLDWDFWCGPAPLHPFNKKIHPKGFRQFLDYANGQLGDWGVHWMDQILWWTEEKYPRRVFSTGGRHILRDNSTAPDTQVVSFEFESFTAAWEHRLYAGNEAEKTNIGCYFYGTEGTFHMGWLDGWTFYPADPKKPTIHQDPHLNKPDDQNIRELWADFIQSIQARKRPVTDIEIGHRSTNMSLLGMLSLKLGRSVQWDGEKETIVGDPEANQLLRRAYRAPWVYPEA